jgi:primase-polymerase (primpol)-like protein
MKNKFEKISTELMTYDQWVCWKYENNPSNPHHPKKPPIDPNTGGSASTTDPSTWGSFEQAKRYYKENKGQVEGVGFVFTAQDPYTGVSEYCNCIYNPTRSTTMTKAELIPRIVENAKLIRPKHNQP